MNVFKNPLYPDPFFLLGFSLAHVHIPPPRFVEIYLVSVGRFWGEKGKHHLSHPGAVSEDY